MSFFGKACTLYIGYVLTEAIGKTYDTVRVVSVGLAHFHPMRVCASNSLSSLLELHGSFIPKPFQSEHERDVIL